MLKRVLKWMFGILAVAFIAIAIFLVNLIWFRPWSLNLFYEKTNPGQACAYKVGMLKIQALRARAEQELGQKFDQREFHETVLKNGALPLEILEEQVNEYIQQKKA